MRASFAVIGVALGLLCATGAGCTALAGIDELVDVPCAQEVCVDDSGADSIAAEVDAAPDSTVEETSDDSGIAEETSGDATIDSSDDTTVDTGADTGAADVGTDAGPTDTGGFDAGPCTSAVSPLATITSGGKTYGIEVTEVTTAQYAAFLAASVSTLGQPGYCLWNSSYTPSGWSAPTASTCHLPVVNVDWCDAYAYCAWAGRRLCGKIDNTSVSIGEGNDASKSQWYRVCTNGGTTTVSYGSTATNGTCVDTAYDGTPGYAAGSDVARAVGSASACHGIASPYSDVLDMTGNVREWEDSCSGKTSAFDDCRTRGGSFQTDAPCSGSATSNRSTTAGDLGFRCCTP
jgi:formylglycine-generating enzyme required for sulfatase activity